MIRFYRPKDYKQVKSILVEGELFDALLDSEAHLLRVIQNDPQSIILAVHNDSIAGTISFNFGRMPMLFRLAVKKEFRRLGIGTTLLETATQILHERGAEEVGFLVNDKKNHLKSFYKKLGWKSGKNTFRWMYKKLP